MLQAPRALRSPPTAPAVQMKNGAQSCRSKSVHHTFGSSTHVAVGALTSLRSTPAFWLADFNVEFIGFLPQDYRFHLCLYFGFPAGGARPQPTMMTRLMTPIPLLTSSLAVGY